MKAKKKSGNNQLKVAVANITEVNFDNIPRPANRHYSCKECFYWVEKKDGRTDLEKQKRNWFRRTDRKYGPLGKLLLVGKERNPVGYIQFGPISEFKTTQLIYESRFPVPKGGWCIACVAILGRYRSQGLATRLVRNVSLDLKRRGVRTIDAYPLVAAKSWNNFSTGPVSLWEKCGFEEVGKIRFDKGEPLPCADEMILMRKKW